MGFEDFQLKCGVCGAGAPARSVAFEKLLDGITQSPALPTTPPIYVAATGNEHSQNGFNYPAAYSTAVAVGSVNKCDYKSSFSNYGPTTHNRYFMAPGGEENPVKNVTEYVGVGGRGARATKCRGTSVSTAYACGMLAVLRSEPSYSTLDRDTFLNNVVAGHCNVPAHVNKTIQDQYGAGTIAYNPHYKPRQSTGSGTAVATSSHFSIKVFGSHVQIGPIKVARRVEEPLRIKIEDAQGKMIGDVVV